MNADTKDLILNAFYPAKCLFCDDSLSPDSLFWLCDDCRNNMPKLVDPTCPNCSGVMKQNGLYRRCETCGESKKTYLLNIDYFKYANNAHDAVLRLKYSNAVDHAKPMAELMLANMKNAKIKTKFDIVVPMPISKNRLKQRGYNQSEFLAKQIAKNLDLPVDTKSLLKIKETPPQTTLTEREREKNLKEAFGVFENNLENKKVLLVDDVSTTGTSINEASDCILKQGKAKSVNAIVFALTDNE